MFLRLPVGRRSFPSPKEGATDLPKSKTVGNPSAILRASGATTATPSAVAAIKKWRDKVPGAFERHAAKTKTIAAQGPIRERARAILEQAERNARFRAAKIPILGKSRQTGIDWIKYGRRIRPADPGGVLGLMRATRDPAIRGSSADAARVPAGVLKRLAEKAATHHAVPLITGRAKKPVRRAF